MGARELLADLSGAGFSITANGERLVIRPASKLTDPLRAALREVKPELLALLVRGAAHLSLAWGADVIESYTVRHARLTARGFSDEQAEALAERLVRRDLEGDDRRICAECGALDRHGRCRVAAAGRLHGASRQLEPVPTILQRCEGFTLAQGRT